MDVGSIQVRFHFDSSTTIVTISDGVCASTVVAPTGSVDSSKEALIVIGIKESLCIVDAQFLIVVRIFSDVEKGKLAQSGRVTLLKNELITL